MNAKEAREMALDITDGNNQLQYDDVMKKIIQEVKKGATNCYYYNTLKPAVLAKLESDGYTVTSYSDQRNGTIVTIKW